MNSERKSYIYRLILKTYKICNITSFPFDCKKVINEYGYDCKAYSSLSERKQKICFGISDDACIMKGTIYYNDMILKDRIRFTLMHELGHLLLKHFEKSDIEEDEADYFASCILAPRIMIHHLCLNNKYSKVTADDIHEYFDISISASNRALMDYHNWYSEIARTTRKPTDIELAIKELFVEKPKPSKTRKRNVKRNSPVVRYLLDPSNDEYIIREMERRRTEPY